jgi:hypothetical protein
VCFQVRQLVVKRSLRLAAYLVVTFSTILSMADLLHITPTTVALETMPAYFATADTPFGLWLHHTATLAGGALAATVLIAADHRMVPMPAASVMAGGELSKVSNPGTAC